MYVVTRTDKLGEPSTYVAACDTEVCAQALTAQCNALCTGYEMGRFGYLTLAEWERVQAAEVFGWNTAREDTYVNDLPFDDGDLPKQCAGGCGRFITAQTFDTCAVCYCAVCYSEGHA